MLPGKHTVYTYIDTVTFSVKRIVDSDYGYVSQIRKKRNEKGTWFAGNAAWLIVTDCQNGM